MARLHIVVLGWLLACLCWVEGAAACDEEKPTVLWPQPAPLGRTLSSRHATLPQARLVTLAGTSNNTSQSTAYCVLEISEPPTAERARYDVDGVASWALISISSLPCDPTSVACSKDLVRRALESAESSVLSGERSHRLGQLDELVPLVLAWLQSPADSEFKHESLIAEVWKSVTPDAQSAAGTAYTTFWTPLAPSVQRRLFIGRSLTQKCDLKLTRQRTEAPDPETRVFKDRAIGWVANGRNKLDDALGSNMVRVSFKGDDHCRRYCSGFLLNSDVVLTAGHCVRPTDNDQHVFNCALYPAQCESYVVDVDYRKGGTPRRSMPVHYAYANQALDFALLYLRPPAPTALASGSPLSANLKPLAPSTDERLVLLAHPGGVPMMRSNCSVVDDTHESHLAAHRCPTSGGSSGGILWTEHDSRPMPTTLHTTSVDSCFDGVIQGSESLSPEFRKRLSQLNLLNEDCVGMGLKVGRIYEELCLGSNKRVEDCDYLLRGLIDDPMGARP